MTTFPLHDQDSAPEQSRDTLSAIEGKLGFLPNIYGVFAESPAVIKAYTSLSHLLNHGSFSPAEQQLMLLTVSVTNDCGYCVAAHTMGAMQESLGKDVIKAVRNDTPIADDRLATLHGFTKTMVKNRGQVPAGGIEAFMGAGYTKSHVLEVALAVALKTMSNYINHFADTPLDTMFEDARWEEDSEAYVA